MKSIVKHIEGSRAYGIGYRDWFRQRHFIAAEIDNAGTLLDLGCANGFFMCCLQRWSGHPFTPYGIDIDPVAIASCRQLFRDQHRNFACIDVRDFANELPAGFPSHYDSIFWNMPNSWSVDEKRRQLNALMPLVAPGGKLLVATYGSNARDLDASGWEAEGRAVAAAFTDLQARGVVFRHVRHNPLGTHHGVGRIERLKPHFFPV